MDDSAVQTAVCVIGHPIAGNPAQFSLQRALAQLGVDWQCLSFDVPPESLGEAIRGIDVLGFAAALIAPPHHSSVSSLVSDDGAAQRWFDGVVRSHNRTWEGCNFFAEAVAESLESHCKAIAAPLHACVFVGTAEQFDELTRPFHEHLPPVHFFLSPEGIFSRRPPEQPDAAEPPETEDAAGSDTVPAADSEDRDGEDTSEPSPVAGEPPADQATPDAGGLPEAIGVDDELWSHPVLWIDPAEVAGDTAKGKSKLSSQTEEQRASLFERLHPDSLRLAASSPPGISRLPGPQAGSAMKVLTPLDLEVARLAAAIRRWTGLEADRELLLEAIEEFLEL